MTEASFRAGAVNGGNGTTGSVTLPGTLVDGDWGLLVFATNDGMGAPSTPSGWSALMATVSIVAKERLTYFVKQYAPGDANPSVTWGVASNWSAAAVWYSGASGYGTPGTLTSAGSGTAVTANALSTTSADNKVLSIFTHFNGGGGGATSAVVAPDAVVRASRFSASTFAHAIWIGDASKPVAGATNTQTATFDLTATGMSGAQVAVLPALPLQTWVPTTDSGATVAGWTKVPSGAASIAAVLADTDPATYIESGDNPSALVYQTPTFSLAVPSDLTSVKLRVSGYLATGTTGSRLVQLYQGATLIKQQTVTLTGSNVETVIALSGTEAGSMTATSSNWNNLSVKISDTAS